jgi:hypothetical protein
MIVHAHIACAAATAGGLDCAVVVDRDRAAVWQRAFEGHVTITSELPFGATPEVTMDLAPESPDGARWIAPRAFEARDFLPCAVTTVRAELDGDGGALWRGSIELPRTGCAHPPVVVRARCDHGIEGQPPDETASVIACELLLDRDLAMPLRVYARRDDEPPQSGDFDGRTASATFPDDGSRARLRFAITTADGAIVWRGHAPCCAP